MATTKKAVVKKAVKEVKLSEAEMLCEKEIKILNWAMPTKIKFVVDKFKTGERKLEHGHSIQYTKLYLVLTPGLDLKSGKAVIERKWIVRKGVEDTVIKGKPTSLAYESNLLEWGGRNGRTFKGYEKALSYFKSLEE